MHEMAIVRVTESTTVNAANDDESSSSSSSPATAAPAAVSRQTIDNNNKNNSDSIPHDNDESVRPPASTLLRSGDDRKRPKNIAIHPDYHDHDNGNNNDEDKLVELPSPPSMKSLSVPNSTRHGHGRRHHRRSSSSSSSSSLIRGTSPGHIRRESLTLKPVSISRHSDEDNIKYENLKPSYTEIPQHFFSFIHPDSRFRYLWNILIVIFTIYLCIQTSASVGYDWKLRGAFLVMAVLQDLFFLCDIYVTCVTGIYDNRLELVDRVLPIMWTYIRSIWFPLDVLGSIPLDLVSLFLEDVDMNNVGVYQVLKSLRLVRAFRLFDLIETRATLIVNESIRSIKTVVMLLLMGHWVACYWFFIARINDINTGTDQSLSPAANTNATDNINSTNTNNNNNNNNIIMNWAVERDILAAPLYEQWIVTIYFSFTTLFTIGFGDILPATRIDYVYTCLVFVIATSFYASVTGNVMLTLTNLSEQSALKRSKMLELVDFLRDHNVPESLFQSCIEHTEAKWRKDKGHDERDILRGLPLSLQTEIMRLNHSHMLQKIDMFRECCESFLNALAMSLTTVTLLPGQIICTTDDLGEKMYFVENGVVDISIDGVITAELSEGCCFGESALIYGIYRTTARAQSYCDLGVLASDDFDMICSNYPELREIFHKRAELEGTPYATYNTSGVVFKRHSDHEDEHQYGIEG